jgi:microcystin-dependent protein
MSSVSDFKTLHVELEEAEVAYPPNVPPNTRQNTTPLVNNHPSDHNMIADALRDVLLALGNDPAGADTDVQARLDRMETDLNPVGTIIAFAGTGTPKGRWRRCSGGSESRSGVYAALFTEIGTTWGSPSGTTFGIPDLRGRSLVGNEGVPAKAIGTSWGDADPVVAAHTHVMPQHNHVLDHAHTIDPPPTFTVPPTAGGKTWYAAGQTSGGPASGAGILHNKTWHGGIVDGPASIAWIGLPGDNVPMPTVDIGAFNSHGPSNATTTLSPAGAVTDNGVAGGATTTVANRNFPLVGTVNWWIRY